MVIVSSLKVSDADQFANSMETTTCGDTPSESLSNESGMHVQKRRSSLLGRSLLLLFQATTDGNGGYDDHQSATTPSMGKKQQAAEVASRKVLRKSSSLPTQANKTANNRRGSEEKRPRKIGSRLGRAAKRSFLKNKSRAASELTLRLSSSSRWGDEDSLCDDDDEAVMVSESPRKIRKSQSLPIDLKTMRAPVADVVVDIASSPPDGFHDSCCMHEAALKSADERSDPAAYSRSKGTHPMFDGRFVEMDNGLISLDQSWQERRQSRPSTRRGGRRPRPSASEQNS